jgi:hypothetical protein
MCNKLKDKKEQAQFLSSIGVLLAGLVLIFIAVFLEPVGVIHYSVITVFGMLLTFVGAVWNLDLRYDFKTKELKRTIEDEINKKKEEEI